ncbi:MAG: DUF11 domain-containing protein, partial [Phycisphaerales bacterium]|nr:DUF11 domain-containing protein [Phycisphaerales bacterium]
MSHTARTRAAIAATTLMMALSGAAVAQTGSLETGPDTNGTGGVFMNLSPVNDALNILEFEVAIGTTGNTVQIEVWTRPGSYIGFDDNSAGWTLTQTLSAVSQGNGNLVPLTLIEPIELPAGETTAVYLQAVTASGQGIRYNGSGTSALTDWNNSDLVLFSDVARTGAISFGGSSFTPRAFAGVIHYEFAGPTDPFDVRILGSADPSNIGIGDNTTLTFEVRNPSTADVTGVVVDIELPAGLDYVSDDRSGTLVGNVLTANLG